MSARVLFLTTVAPHRRASGGEVVSQAFVDALRAAGHDVTVVAYARQGERRPPPGTLVAGARHIETDSAPLSAVAPWMARALADHVPYSVAKYRSRGYEERVRSLLSTGRFHTIVLDHAQVGWLAPLVEGACERLVLLAHNVEHQVYAGRALNARTLTARALYRREARLARALEQSLARVASEVWTLTGDDAHAFESFGGAGVRTFAVPSAFSPEPASAAPRPRRREVGMIGTWTWRPNAEALRWFVDDVRPALPRDLMVEVAGRGAQWLAGLYDNIRYRGPVPDAHAFMAGSSALAIPAVEGGGIQVKTLDAIASGTRVVATPRALRGISDPPRTVRVRERPADVAAEIVRAAGDPRCAVEAEEALEWTLERGRRFRDEVAQRLEGLEPVASTGAR